MHRLCQNFVLIQGGRKGYANTEPCLFILIDNKYKLYGGKTGCSYLFNK